MYRQCHLVRGSTHQISWIHDHKSIVGKTVDIRAVDHEWDRGWTVLSAGADVRTWEQVNRDSRAHTWQRRSSDI